MYAQNKLILSVNHQNLEHKFSTSTEIFSLDYLSIFSFWGQSSYQWARQGSDRELCDSHLLQPGVQPSLGHQVDGGWGGAARQAGGGQLNVFITISVEIEPLLAPSSGA